ncbi:MAG: Gloeobacter/Verrucomicrobia repeat [Verrucomicrobiales bacterium]|nr:Gloeobacter/Verrucomicrobia repeat [Verrucomicrobiales bacterium]
MSAHRLLSRLLPVLTFLLPALLPVTASAANGSIYQPLAGFPASLANPVRGRLTLHTDGNFHGGDSNIEGGGPGLLYRISPDGRVAAVARLVYPLDGFTGSTRPSERLVSDAAGRLWGIASKPSSAAIAAIFHFTPASGQYVEVIEFNTLPGANFSTVPVSNLVPDGQVHFWFLTVTNNFEKGVKETSLHRLDPVSGALTLLSTVPREQEAAPDLAADGLGFLWGQSPNGNGDVDGSVYKISVPTGIRTTVAAFGWDRGRRPVGGLSPDGKGFFWGTTAEAGAYGMGTVYKVETATGALTIVADIPDTVTGGGIKTSRPSTALCADGRGWMWGTTDEGGISMGSGYFGAGTVFKVNIQTGNSGRW